MQVRAYLWQRRQREAAEDTERGGDWHCVEIRWRPAGMCGGGAHVGAGTTTIAGAPNYYDSLFITGGANHGRAGQQQKYHDGQSAVVRRWFDRAMRERKKRWRAWIETKVMVLQGGRKLHDASACRRDCWQARTASGQSRGRPSDHGPVVLAFPAPHQHHVSEFILVLAHRAAEGRPPSL